MLPLNILNASHGKVHPTTHKQPQRLVGGTPGRPFKRALERLRAPRPAAPAKVITGHLPKRTKLDEGNLCRVGRSRGRLGRRLSVRKQVWLAFVERKFA